MNNYIDKLLLMQQTKQLKQVEIEVNELNFALLVVTSTKNNKYHRLYHVDTGLLGCLGQSAIEVFKKTSSCGVNNFGSSGI